MAKTQVGYLGRTGPVFVDDSTVAGKFIILVGNIEGGQMVYKAKQPAFAGNLTGFPYTAAQCSLGPYNDNQTVVVTEAYKVPPTGDQFDAYLNVEANWVAGTVPANTTPGSGGGGSTGGGSTGGGSTGGGSTGGGSTGGGSTGGGSTGGGDVTYTAPTISQQISTFLSNYWWLVLLIAVALLYKPVIAPLLGLGGKKKRYR